MRRTITKWRSAKAEWQDFARAHPELGYDGGANSWIHFQRRHGDRLKSLDVIRQTGPRRPMIADTERFEPVVFDLLTLGELPEQSTTVAA
ncbi:hypothetical protein BH160DRAFT_0393 [Burkholderia sp. H160]|nr:hypothetical protein BH160DRAFT_0393 [Burkholderia sp. H160]